MTDMSGKFDVGYCKPPQQHQFKKGQSGNPNGRPRGAKSKAKPFDPALQPTDGLILEEAYRPVSIREGDKVIELPAIQAAVRALAISAMKGSRLSQRALSELVLQVDDREASERLTMMENALEYKQKWTAELDRRRRTGSTEPDPIPHPDDIIINLYTGHVHTAGPIDEREKRDWDKRLARRAEAQEEVNAFAENYRKARTPKSKAMWLSEWHFEQRIFDIINDGLPDRYKAKLENRSHREGASVEGKALEEFRRSLRRGPESRQR